MDGKIHTSYSGFVNITIPVRELNVLSATDFREQNGEMIMVLILIGLMN